MLKLIIFSIIKVLFAVRVILFFLIIICKIKYNPIIIHSEKLMNIISMIGGFPKDKAKASAIFPFVVLRFKQHEMNEAWIRHETIHHYQMIETAGLIFLYTEIEYWYARKVLGHNHMDAYLYKATEQECYLHQLDSDYLKNRKIFGFWKYIKHKKRFELVDYKVVQY